MIVIKNKRSEVCNVYTKKCRMKDCSLYVKARELCEKHYARWLRNGDPTKIKTVEPKSISECTIKDCAEIHYSKGLCRTHYTKEYEYPRRKAKRNSIRLNKLMSCQNQLLRTIGYNLKLLRFKYNFTQTHVSEATGIHVKSISRYENDESFPKKEEIQKLADFYKVEVEEILVGDDAVLPHER
jgi:predicted DNA-binding transcriptional regulator AlpA